MADKNNNIEQLYEVPRRFWPFLPKVDFYVLKEFLIPFVVLMIGCIFLFLIGDIFDDLRDFLDNNAPFSEILEYFILKLPGNIRFILPMSVLLACMYEMANFGKHMEIVAMRASGISVHRACASIYFVAFIIAIITFLFNESIVPISEKRAYEILKRRSNQYWVQGQYNMLTFRSSDGMRTWFFRNFNENGEQESVILKKYRKDTTTLEWDIEAESASFIPQKGWLFKNATITPYFDDGFLPKKSEKFEEKFLDINSLPDTPTQIINSVKAPEDLESIVILKMLLNTKNMSEKLKNIYKTTLYYRLAFPWASLIAVFLGVPLAAKNQRGGIFIAIASAVLIIASYQLISHLFIIFGNRGILPPSVAGLLPTCIFIVFAWKNAARGEI